jgi:hypothetical protein
MTTRQISYVPVLKTKAGERWSLSHLKAATKATVRPLVEFHAHADKPLGDHVESVCDALEAAWGVDRWFYVDTIWLHGNYGSPAIIGTVFQIAEAANLKVLPVVRTSYDDASLEQLRAVVVANERGYLLRVTPEVLLNPKLIDNVVGALEISRAKIDFMLDYRHHPMALATDVQQVPHLDQWRSFITSSGVFPKTLTHIPLHTWQDIQRNDWISWSVGVEGKLARKPIYSDYAMRAPGPPAEFGAPSVNLRYALDTRWLVHIGGKFAEGAAPEMHTMCDQLIARPEFCGSEFSAGDEEISRVADPDEGPGGPTQWLQWCLSHHIEFVVSQLSQSAA